MEIYTIDNIMQIAFDFIENEVDLIFESNTEQQAAMALRISAIVEFIDYLKEYPQEMREEKCLS